MDLVFHFPSLQWFDYLIVSCRVFLSLPWPSGSPKVEGEGLTQHPHNTPSRLSWTLQIAILVNLSRIFFSPSIIHVCIGVVCICPPYPPLILSHLSNFNRHIYEPRVDRQLHYTGMYTNTGATIWCVVSGRWFWLGNASFEIVHLPLPEKKDEGKERHVKEHIFSDHSMFGLKKYYNY